MKRPLHALFAAAVLAVAAAVPQAHAVFHFTLTEAGGDVDILGAGTIDTTDLTPAGAFSVGTFMDPRIAVMTVGAFATNDGFHYSGVTGPSDFGTGGFNSATTALGDLVGIETPSGYVDVPNGYVSGRAAGGFRHLYRSIVRHPGTDSRHLHLHLGHWGPTPIR